MMIPHFAWSLDFLSLYATLSGFGRMCYMTLGGVDCVYLSIGCLTSARPSTI